MAHLSFSYPAPYADAHSAATRSLLYGEFANIKSGAGHLKAVQLVSMHVIVVDVVAMGEDATVITVSSQSSWFRLDLFGRRMRMCVRVQERIANHLTKFGPALPCPPALRVPKARLL